MNANKHNHTFWVVLTVFSLVGQVAWVMENMYFNVFIYQEFHASADAISAMVAASALTATLTTLLMGALSDKLGRRKSFICIGYLCWGLSIWSFALIRADVIHGMFGATVNAASIGCALVIAMDCVMTFFGSTANDAAFNAWLTDSTDHTNRGAAEGINAMMPLMAILVVFGGAMLLDPDSNHYWTVFFGVIGTAVTLIGILGFFLIREPTIVTQGNERYFQNIFYGFRPSVIRQNPRFYQTLAAYAVFGIAIQIFMPYLILYFTVTLKMDNYVLIFAPAILLAGAFTALYGRCYDKLGFTKSILPALGLLMGGFVLLYFFTHIVFVFMGTLMMMCGYLAGMAVFGAMLRDHTPAGKAGMFQGQRIVGQVLIPGIIGPAIGAAVLRNAQTVQNSDGTSSFVPNQNIFLASLLAAVVILPLLLPLMKKKRARLTEEIA